MAQYGLPRREPLTPGTPRVSPSAVEAHKLLDQTVGSLIQQFAPQYANKIPPEKATQTFRQVLKTSDFMTKAMVMSVVGQHLPKGVTAEDIGKAVNEAPPAAAAPAAAAPTGATELPPVVVDAPEPKVTPGPSPAFAAARAPTAAGSSEHYRKMREPFAAELNDPATRRLVKGIISAENPGAGSAVVESLMNRTAMVNEHRKANGQPPVTLKSMIQGDPSIGGGKSFYGPVRTGAVNEHLRRVDADKNYSAQLDGHISAALGGADTIKGHTDQGSKGDPNYDAGGVGVNINGERFNDWGYAGSKAWREKNQTLMSYRSGDSATSNRDAEGGEGSNIAANAHLPAEERGYAPTEIANTTTSNPGTDTPTEVAKTLGGKSIGEGIGDAFGDLAKTMGAGAGAGARALPSTPANATAPTPTPSMGAFPTVDPKVADAQRQMLAMALQRLNSGRLH